MNKPPRRPPGARSTQEMLAMRRAKISPEEKAKTDVFSGKDAWGYRFAQPIMKVGVDELMKRAPEDKDRERINAVLWREFEMKPHEGFDGEEIPWGLFREEKKTRRRLFAEAVREACKKSRGGMIGIQQAHFLAHQHGLMHTFRAKALRAAFPLDLKIESPVLKSTYEAEYVLQIDRVFYPVHKLPRKDRFAPAMVVADAYRLLDGQGESVVRTVKDKKPLLTIDAGPVASPESAFEWRITLGDHVFTLAEPRAIRSPAFRLTLDNQDVGGCESKTDPGSTKLDTVFAFDVPGEPWPWLGLMAIYLDAFTQRARGILGRAVRAAEEREKREAEELQEIIDEEEP